MQLAYQATRNSPRYGAQSPVGLSRKTIPIPAIRYSWRSIGRRPVGYRVFGWGFSAGFLLPRFIVCFYVQVGNMQQSYDLNKTYGFRSAGRPVQENCKFLPHAAVVRQSLIFHIPSIPHHRRHGVPHYLFKFDPSLSLSSIKTEQPTLYWC